MSRLLALVLVGSALVAGGCGERAEPLGAEVSPFPVTVENADGRLLRVDERPERIVALDPGLAETIAEIGAGDRLVGVPAGFSLARANDATRVVRESGRIDVEDVVALEPDLLVEASTGDVANAATAQRETGAALYVQPGGAITDVVRTIPELGLLVGAPVEARRLAAAMRRDALAVERAVGTRSPARVFVDTGFFVPPPEPSLAADVVRRAGGESVTAGEDQPVPETLCDLPVLEVEVILRLVEPDEAPPRRSFARECADALAGVRFETVPAELVTRPGPRVVDGLRAVARALHPDAFR